MAPKSLYCELGLSLISLKPQQRDFVAMVWTYHVGQAGWSVMESLEQIKNQLLLSQGVQRTPKIWFQKSVNTASLDFQFHYYESLQIKVSKQRFPSFFKKVLYKCLDKPYRHVLQLKRIGCSQMEVAFLALYLISFYQLNLGLSLKTSKKPTFRGNPGGGC